MIKLVLILQPLAQNENANTWKGQLSPKQTYAFMGQPNGWTAAHSIMHTVCIMK